MPSGRPPKGKQKSLLISGDALKIEDAERALAAAAGKGKTANIATLFDAYVPEGNRTTVDIITFCEATWGLGMGSLPGVPKMFPVQKFILKAYYGLPLDNGDDRGIVIRDKFNENTLYQLNEREFLSWLLENHLINTDDLSGKRLNLELVVGRRGSKTTVVSFIVCYELYKMLSLYSPHEYFNIMPDDLIEITSVSNRVENSKNMFDRIAGNLRRSSFFKGYIDGEPNKLDMHFRSQRDAQNYGSNGACSMKLSAVTCSARGLRGPNNFMVLLDEAAFFHKEASGSGSNISDTAIFEAVSPSLAGFIHPNGEPAGRMIIISSPDERTGKLYTEYERSFDPEAGADLLMINLPSWVLNPSIPSAFLKGKYYSSPLTYMSEYGGNFSDRLKGWIEDEDLIRRAMVEGLAYKERSLLRSPHFMGIDIGLKNDGTAVVVCHVVQDTESGVPMQKIEIDYAEVRYADKEKPHTAAGKPQFSPDEIGGWLLEFHDRFYIQRGSMDQHEGTLFEYLLAKGGMTQVKLDTTSDVINSDMYQNLLSQFICNRIRLPAGEIDPKNGRPHDTELVKELLSLQSSQKSKYVVNVEAPGRPGCHDDLSDALARAVWQATKYMEKGTSVMSANSGAPSGLASAYHSRVASEIRKIDLKRSPRAGMGGSRYGGLGGMDRFGRR